ncbi:Hypothetical predicted protein [Mytilus galloprovincialis]|uniref:Uncharacterized protein n=1 Tax=Mytilus galloprovincialis TaxID=29158 RepID=A0A8B6BDM4_MYTGA|nr:Hypothetical predicted protein [Mytilus galloprovincialis]
MLENNFFNTSWEDISQAIGRLGGTSMKQECDILKTKPLDQSNKEIIMEIKHSNEAIEQLTKSFRSLKRSHEEDKRTVKRLKTSHKIVLSENKKDLAICRKFDTVKALLQFTYFTHPSTPECPNTSSRAKATPEVIPISFCSAPTDTSYWKPKGRVIDNCERIPMYARIGVFSNQGLYGYDTSIRKCGVFLGCLKSGSKVVGVKIGMQVCGRPFDIENARFSNEKDLLNLYVF